MSTVYREYYHLLVIEDKLGKRLFQLTGATYTLGRDVNAAIRIFDQSVSRHHALLLRLPNEDLTYSYRFVDGDTHGRPSTNGLIVNKQPCRSKSLVADDLIEIGTTSIQYLVEQFTTEEFAWHYQDSRAIYEKIQSQVVDPTATKPIKFSSYSIK